MPRPIIHTNGYVTFYLPNHHLAMSNGYVYEHRLVLEKKLGRHLKKGEQCHHIDGNKQNNHPDNLEVKDERQHASDHHRKRSDLRPIDGPNRIIYCSCGCGGQVTQFDKSGRPRKYINGHNVNKANSPVVRDCIFLALQSGPKTTKEIVCACPPNSSVNSVLSFLKKDGLVKHIGYGKWSLPD